MPDGTRLLPRTRPLSRTTALTAFGQGIQNPFNPFGSRVQMAWREIDLSLSRTLAEDMDLDVEAMYWGPFTGTSSVFDQFERVSLFFGHSENRPENCLGAFSALPTSRFPSSSI